MVRLCRSNGKRPETGTSSWPFKRHDFLNNLKLKGRGSVGLLGGRGEGGRRRRRPLGERSAVSRAGLRPMPTLLCFSAAAIRGHPRPLALPLHPASLPSAPVRARLPASSAPLARSLPPPCSLVPRFPQSSPFKRARNQSGHFIALRTQAEACH